MVARLHINVAQGTLEVEGDEGFVEKIYNDFKAVLVEGFASIENQADSGIKQDAPDSGPSKKTKKTGGKKRALRKKKEGADGSTPSSGAYTPKLDKSLSLPGIREFLQQFNPSNHSEKILLFAKFLQEKGIEPCSADQIYTCYMTLKERIPAACEQAFITTRGRHGYIDYDGLDAISVTPLGENHFNHDIKRLGSD